MVRNLIPYILNGEIVLHEPDPPFDLLPKTYTEQLTAIPSQGEALEQTQFATAVGQNSTTHSLISSPVRSLLNVTTPHPFKPGNPPVKPTQTASSHQVTSPPQRNNPPPKKPIKSFRSMIVQLYSEKSAGF